MVRVDQRPKTSLECFPHGEEHLSGPMVATLGVFGDEWPDARSWVSSNIIRLIEDTTFK
jgi:hypothetical protein